MQGKLGSERIAIRAGKLIDGKSDAPIMNALIVIEGKKIVSVTAGGTPPADATLIDLSRATVLPGLIDAHTHILLNGDVLAAGLRRAIAEDVDSLPRGVGGAERCAWRSTTASPRCAIWKPKARCTPTWM